MTIFVTFSVHVFPSRKNRTCSTLIKLCQILRILIISNKVKWEEAERVIQTASFGPPLSNNEGVYYFSISGKGRGIIYQKPLKSFEQILCLAGCESKVLNKFCSLLVFGFKKICKRPPYLDCFLAS